MRLYLDSSAVVKLVQEEAESDALRRYLHDHREDRWASSVLARVEVVRAVRASGPSLVTLARRQLGRLSMTPLHRGLLDEAAELAPELVPSLDAIHLVSARRLGKELRALVTYDLPMQSAARDLGLPLTAPQ